MTPRLYFFLLCLCRISAGAQPPDSTYERYKELVRNYASVTPVQSGYLLTHHGLHGFADSAARVAIRPVYEQFGIGNDYVEMKNAGEMVFMDRSYNILARGPYTWIWQMDGAPGYYAVQTSSGKGGIVDKNNQVIIPAEYEAGANSGTAQLPLFLLKKDGKAGAFDTAARIVIPFIYERLAPQGPYLIGELVDSITVYTKAGQLLRTFPYHEFKWIDGWAAASRYGDWALLDKDLKPMTDFLYKDFTTLNSPDFIQFENHFHGVLDRTGRVIVGDSVEWIRPTGDGYILNLDFDVQALTDSLFRPLGSAEEGKNYGPLLQPHGSNEAPVPGWITSTTQDERWGSGKQEMLLINKRTGHKYPYTQVESFFNGRLVALNEAAAGEGLIFSRMPSRGKLRIITSADKILPYTGYGWSHNPGLLPVADTAGKWGMIDSSLNLILPFRYTSLKSVATNVFLAGEKRDSTEIFYLIDPAGLRLLAEPLWGEPILLGPFYRYVTSGGKTGLLHEDFSVAIPAKYEAVSYGYEGRYHYTDSARLIVTVPGGSGVIDTGGRLLIPAEYRSVNFYNRHFILEDTAGKKFVADRQGRIKADPAGQFFLPADFSALVEKRNGRWGFRDQYGRIILPFEYDSTYTLWRSQCQVFRKNGTYTITNGIGDILASGITVKPDHITDDRDTILLVNGAMLRKKGSRFVSVRNPSPYDPDFRSWFRQANEHFHVESYGRVHLPAGIYNRDLRKIAPASRYTRPENRSSGTKLIVQDSLWRVGVIDTTGAFLVPYRKADSLWLFGDFVVTTVDSGHYELYDFSKKNSGPEAWLQVRIGPRTYPANRESYVAYEEHAIPRFIFLENDAGWQMLNTINGSRQKIESPGDLVEQNYGRRNLLRANGRWGTLDGEGHWVISPAYDTLQIVDYNTLLAVKNRRMGILGADRGEVLVPLVYGSIFPGHIQGEHRFYAVKKNGRFSIISEQNEVLFSGADAITAYWGRFSEIRVKKDGQYRCLFYDRNVRVTSSPVNRKFYEDGQYSMGLFEYEEDGKKGIWDERSQHAIVPALYDDVEDEGAGYVAHVRGGQGCRTDVYSRSRKILTAACDAAAEYDSRCDCWFIGVDGKKQAVGNDGRLLTAGFYDDIEPVAEGYLAVERNEKWSLSGPGGRLLFPPKYGRIEPVPGFLVASLGEGSCVLRFRNKALRTDCYDYFQMVSGSPWLYYVGRGGKWGILNGLGEIEEPIVHAVVEELEPIKKRIEAAQVRPLFKYYRR